MTTKSESWVLTYDIHAPVYHKPSVGALLHFLEENKVDGFLFGGDQLDLNCISHWTKGQPGTRTKGALKKSLDGFNKDILTPIEQRLRPGAKKVWLTGNHERFLQDLLDEQPELHGLLDIEGYLRLKERVWKVVPLAGHYKLGRLNAIHGETVGGGMNPAKKAVEIWCSSVALGHHHTSQNFTKAAPAHTGRRWTGTVLPCLSTTIPTYGRGRANTWVNGFGIVEIRPNRDFNLYSVTITDGEFSFAGKTYSGKKAKKKKATRASLRPRKAA